MAKVAQRQVYNSRLPKEHPNDTRVQNAPITTVDNQPITVEHHVVKVTHNQ